MLVIGCCTTAALLARREPNRAQPRPSPDKGLRGLSIQTRPLRPYLNTIPLPSSHLTRPITTTSLAGNPGNNHILSTAGFQSSFSCPGAANFVFFFRFFSTSSFFFSLTYSALPLYLVDRTDSRSLLIPPLPPSSSLNFDRSPEPDSLSFTLPSREHATHRTHDPRQLLRLRITI